MNKYRVLYTRTEKISFHISKTRVFTQAEAEADIDHCASNSAVEPITGAHSLLVTPTIARFRPPKRITPAGRLCGGRPPYVRMHCRLCNGSTPAERSLDRVVRVVLFG